MQTTIPDGVRPTFRALAQVVVPETGAMAAEEWSTLEATVARALSVRSAVVRKQVTLFLRLIEFLAIARYARRFSRLDPQKATKFLQALEHAPLLAVRRGVWGIRTLVMMGVYTQPGVQAALGYRPHRDGWSARRRSGEHQAVLDT